MRSYLLSFIVLVFLIAPHVKPVYAQDVRFPVISAAELKANMDSGKKQYIVDARSRAEYMEGHLPGAVNVPPEKFNQLPGLLPNNKSYPIVFYCRGWS